MEISKPDEAGVRLQGMQVTHAGDLRTMGLDRFKALVQIQGGTYTKSPISVHLVVCGEDAGDKPLTAYRSNPEVLVWDEDAFMRMIRAGNKRPIISDPAYLLDCTPEPKMVHGASAPVKTPESYGDF